MSSEAVFPISIFDAGSAGEIPLYHIVSTNLAEELSARRKTFIRWESGNASWCSATDFKVSVSFLVPHREIVDEQSLVW